jgi:hypothetical protein
VPIGNRLGKSNCGSVCLIEQFGIKGERKKGGREAKLEYYHRYEYFRIS